MNYYKHNIGDYRRDTAHLSLTEHGIYRQMLDQYYLDEKPLTADKEKLMRSLCVRSADDIKAAENVLNDFFKLTKKGYEHVRCERELERIYQKSEKARQSAKCRWSDKNQRVTDSDNANASETHNNRNAIGMLPTTHNPLPTTHNPSKTKEDMFFRFWENYPRKTDKKKARLAFNKLSQPDKELAIADCKTRYINTEKQYIPHATTYLNGERFNDEVIDGQINNQQRANTAAAVGDFFEKEANAAARRLSESPDAEVQSYIPAKVGRTIQDH